MDETTSQKELKPQAGPSADSLLDYAAIARRLNVSARQARRLVARGHLRCVDLGHRTKRFRPADLDRLIARRAGDSGSDGDR